MESKERKEVGREERSARVEAGKSRLTERRVSEELKGKNKRFYSLSRSLEIALGDLPLAVG